MSEQVMEELWNGLSPATNSMELANAVIDRLQELNIDLQDVSLAEMKNLLAKACTYQAERQMRNPRLSDCLVSQIGVVGEAAIRLTIPAEIT